MKNEASLPKSVKVMGHKIRIVFTDETDNHGEYIHDCKLIKVNSTLPPKDQWVALYHELLHCALAISGMSEILGNDREEGVVRALENLSSILRLNN